MEIKETPFEDTLIAEHDLTLFMTDKELSFLKLDIKSYLEKITTEHEQALETAIEERDGLQVTVDDYEDNSDKYDANAALSAFEGVTNWQEYEERKLELFRTSLKFEKPLSLHPPAKAQRF